SSDLSKPFPLFLGTTRFIPSSRRLPSVFFQILISNVTFQKARFLEVPLSKTNSTHAIYYTRDGLDPRRIGGSIGATAQLYTNRIPVSGHTLVKARVRNRTLWSPLIEADLYVPSEYSALQPTEIYYHPSEKILGESDDFEFIELTHLGSQMLDLDGFHFTQGIEFEFPKNYKISAGEVVILVANRTNFALRFPGVPMNGVYKGRLANSGETLTLSHNSGIEVFTLSYQDSKPWPSAADGSGASLQRIEFNQSASDTATWRTEPPTPGVPPDYSSYDSDGDSLPDAWERQFGTDPHQLDTDSDPDGDGLVNRDEYLACTNPNSPDSRPFLRVNLTLNGQINLGFTAISNRIYSIQRRLEWGTPWELWKKFDPKSETTELNTTDTTTDSEARWYRLFISR
ncbi:MAG: hypothetical protein EXS25_07170, partial [Pedosphaera sp.]|nr:hypothetical protein [Pedosphaera sp.]